MTIAAAKASEARTESLIAGRTSGNSQTGEVLVAAEGNTHGRIECKGLLRMDLSGQRQVMQADFDRDEKLRMG